MNDKKIYQVSDVFTPTTPARLTFIERDSINKKIVRALKTPGTQLVVFGHSGTGKTTLLVNKLHQIYEKHIKTHCMKDMSFEAVVLDAFDQLSVFYKAEIELQEKSKIDANIKANFTLISSQIGVSKEEMKTDKLVRTLPLQLTAQNLARFMGAAGYCWIIDDFHKMNDGAKEKLAQVMKVFVDMSQDYKLLKIICVGAVDTARQVVKYDKEMKNRVSEIHVPLMTFEEISQIIKKGFDLLNVRISYSLMCEDIFEWSSGLPSTCHKLCLLMCEHIDVEKTIGPHKEGYFRRPSGEKVDLPQLMYAMKEYIDECSDTIKSSFDKAFMFSDSYILLEALSECSNNGESLDGLVNIIEESHEMIIDPEAADEILECLTFEEYGAIVRYNQESGIYSFASLILLSFARHLFEETSYRQGMSQGERQKLLDAAFRNMKYENIQ